MSDTKKRISTLDDHVRTIKDKYGDVLVLTKSNDMYLAFGEDARVLSKVTGFPLANSGGVLSSGILVKKVDYWLSKFPKGTKVALVEDKEIVTTPANNVLALKIAVAKAKIKIAIL